MEGLGRVFNVVAVADDVYVSLKDCQAVTFLGYKSGGDTFTITEGTTAAGGTTAVLAKITNVYTSTGVGTGAWTKVTQAAGSAYVASADCVAFTIPATALSDGKKYLKCASTSTGTVVAIVHDLNVQRTPANLAILSA
jgi:polygalacturonase